jgi:hypothetical protein
MTIFAASSCSRRFYSLIELQERGTRAIQEASAGHSDPHAAVVPLEN